MFIYDVMFSQSHLVRLGVALAGALLATGVIFAIMAFLSGFFFKDKEVMEVTPCYFAGKPPNGAVETMKCESSPPEESGIARMYKSFLPQDSVSPGEAARKQFEDSTKGSQKD